MAKLIDLINFQLENAKALALILRKETSAITSRNSLQIEKFAKEKLNLIEQLKSTDKRISEHQDINLLNSDHDLFDNVKHIQTIIFECQQVNQVNGQSLLRAQSSFTKLNNLLQHTHGKIGMTYDAEGKTHTLSTLGTIFRA